MSTVAELDTILARLATLDDEKLEAPLAKLLPRLLSPQMVGAQDAALRGKVIQILTHCNKRVKAAPKLQLPVAGATHQLCLAFQRSSLCALSPTTCCCCASSPEHVRRAPESQGPGEQLHHHVPRFRRAATCARSERAAVWPADAADRSATGGAAGHAAPPPAGRRTALRAANRGEGTRRGGGTLCAARCRPGVREGLLHGRDGARRVPTAPLVTPCPVSCLSRLLRNSCVQLYFPLATAPAEQAAAPVASVQAAANFQNQARAAAVAMQRGPQSPEQIQAAEAARAAQEAARTLTPGLSSDRAKRVEGKVVPEPVQLTGYKQAILHAIKGFEGSGVLSTAQLLPLLLAGTCDFNDEVCRKADDQLRGLAIDMEDADVLKAMFVLITGTPKHMAAKTPAGQRVLPARVTLRAKVMQKLLLSIAATSSFPGNLEAIVGCLFHTQPGETGDSLLRVRVLGMEFARWVVKHSTDAKLFPIASVLHSSLLKVIQEGVTVPLATEGATPRGGSGSLVNTVRGLAFHALAELAVRKPSLVNTDASIVRLFFKILGSEDEDDVVRSYVREALTALIAVYVQASAEVLSAIEDLLEQTFIRTGDSNTRFTVVYWTNQLFPFDHISSRHINLMAVGDSQDDVAEEARFGLTPGHHVSQGGLRASAPLGPGRGAQPGAKQMPPHPAFTQMALAIVENTPDLLRPTDTEHLPFQAVVCTSMLAFLRACLESDCKSNLPAHLLKLLNEESAALDAYEALLRSLFVSSADSKLQMTVALALDEYLSALPEVCPRRAAFAEPAVASWLRRWVLHTTDEKTQEALALALGASAHGAGEEAVDRLAQGLLKVATNESEGIGERYGATVSVGVLLSQTVDDTAEGKDRFLLSPDRRSALALGLFDVLAVEKHEAVRRALCIAIGSAGQVDSLPLPLGEFPPDPEPAGRASGGASEPEPSDKDAEEPPSPTRYGVICCLVTILEDPKAKGKLAMLAATTIGQLCLGDRSAEAVDMCQAALLRTPDTMQGVGDAGYESQFVVGKALVSIASAKDVTGQAKVDPQQSAEPMDADAIAVEHDCTQALVSVVFKRLAAVDKLKHRGAACIWLFCLVDALGSHTAVRSRLIDAQKVFMMMLGDRSDLIQEVASRGVAVVYDRSDAETRSTLVKSLVGGLSNEKQGLKPTGVDGSADREVFGVDSAALGKAPDGSGTSTYKELCSLVNDMGQPDLIYKFMGLAAHGQMLNNQAGLSLGLGSIAQKAQAELAPLLPSLIPKLYRYQFDPTPKVQQSMRAMWGSLVDDTKAATEEHFAAIVSELLPSMGERQWRVREASAAGLADLISGRPPAVVRPFLAEMWRMVLRAMDDIKETVRTAAIRAGRTLANISVKLCDNGNASPKEGPLDCEVVIPYLMKQGLNADAEEVRSFALKHLIRVAKSAGPWLRPHIPAIAPAMLESMSLMENAMLNYAQFHVQDKETLESMRAAASASGPCAEVLDLCIKYSDESTVSDLVPRLSQLVRAAVGLPSRVGVGRFIVQLCTTHPATMGPPAPKIAKTLVSVIRVEASVPVQRSLSSALASCCKLCKPSLIVHIIEELMDHYQEARGMEARRTVAISVRDLQNQAGDAAQEVMPKVLPVAYMGRRDTDSSLAAVWERVWDDGASAGEAAAIAAHVTPILRLATGLLANPTYVLRAQGAAAVAAVAKAAANKPGGGASVVKIPPALLRRTVAALAAALSGRLWDGKEAVLHALAALAEPLASLTPEELALELELEVIVPVSRKRHRAGPATESAAEGSDATAMDIAATVGQSGEDGTAMDVDSGTSGGETGGLGETGSEPVDGDEEQDEVRIMLEPCDVSDLGRLVLQQCSRPKASFRLEAIKATMAICPVLDAATAAALLPDVISVVEVGVSSTTGGGVDDDDQEEDDAVAMRYDDDGEIMAGRRRRQRQRDEYSAAALSCLQVCWPDCRSMDAAEAAAIQWPAFPQQSEEEGGSTEGAAAAVPAAASLSNENALASKYAALVAAAMAQTAQNVRSAALAAMGAFVDRASFATLSSQLPALLPCVLTGMADLKAAEIRRLSIAAAAKQLELVVRMTTPHPGLNTLRMPQLPLQCSPATLC
jgi:proteasome component ECM29